MANQYVPTLKPHTRKTRNVNQRSSDTFAEQQEQEAPQSQQKQQLIADAVNKMMNPQADSSDIPSDYGTSMEDM